MKKHLVLGFLILFVLSTTAFAGLSNPKKDSEKPAVLNTREIKLSNEELSRMNRRAETDNLSKTNIISNKRNVTERFILFSFVNKYNSAHWSLYYQK